MFLYENNKCPVCHKVFEEGDDVVSCPECGTPHHRECYKSIGKCANKDLHETDFVYNRNENEATEENSEIPNIQQIAEEIRKAAETENAETVSVNNGFENAQTENKIDGVSSLDVETVVGSNSERFMKKFSKKGKLGWNWGAFFFGPFYFMYRKMYTESLIFLALPMAIGAIINYAFASVKPVVDKITTEFLKCLYEYDVAKLAAYLKDSFAAPENKQAWMSILISLGTVVVLGIVAAVIADNQYRKRVVNIIKTVNEKIDLGESFSFVGSMMGNENMSQSDLRKIFLAKQGGVNIFLPCILLVFSVFSSVL